MPDQPAQTLNLDQFAARFERAAPVLWCVAAGVLGSRHAAEDAVQEAALQAMANTASPKRASATCTGSQALWSPGGSGCAPPLMTLAVSASPTQYVSTPGGLTHVDIMLARNSASQLA